MSHPLIIDGQLVKQQILTQLKSDLHQLNTTKKPGLAVILVGDNAASKVYVTMKKKACDYVGIRSFEYSLASSTSEEELASLIQDLNQDDRIHGILLQVPLPKGLNETALLDLIDPKKDVDGFHPFNVGSLLLGRPTFQSCTPYGVCQLLEHYQIETAGKHVVILGRSNIVGKPLAAMLMQRRSPGNATVTLCHSRSTNIKAITRQADILIVAIGQPEFVTASMLKEKAVVIDVGMNRIDDATTKKGYRLVGDVHYQDVYSKTAAISPVPGGVGPMTIAMLMKNTLQSFKNKESLELLSQEQTIS